MSKRSKSEKASWRPAGSSVSAGDRMKAACVALALLAAGALTFIMPAREADAAGPAVVIRRVMTSNPQVCYSVEGEYYDWIELENLSADPVNLAGWRLTDTGDLRDAFPLPDVTVDPGATRVVYCDDTPEGYEGDAIFTGFRLSSDGELLLLADPMQRTAAVSVPALRKGFVYQRDPQTGEYHVLPFGELSDSEKAERALAVGFDPNSVMLSELMPVNRSILADADGDFTDYIELYNPTSVPVSLEGWALTDDDIKRAKWVFPARTLQAREYLVVFASGKNRRDPAGELHTNFKLSAQGETVRLSNPAGEVVSQIGYDRAESDQALTRLQDGAVTGELAPSPGRPRPVPGEQAEAAAAMENAAGLYINEIYFGRRGVDWVELYNAADHGLDLSGAGLSDNPGKPRKWQFPDGAAIPAGGYVVVELAGSLEKQAQRLAEATVEPNATPAPVLKADYSADFGLVTGETLCLSTSAGKLVDRVMLPAKQDDATYGRAQGFGTLRWFGQATPGAANAAQSYEAVGQQVTLSPSPGIIRDSAIEVTLSCDAGVDIFYTTDGTEPTEKSKVYSGPIALKENTMIRAVADPRAVLYPEPAVASYIFGPHDMRLVCVTGRAKDLTRSDGALNTGVKGDGTDVYVEMYEPDGTKLIGQSVHFTLTGHHSRTHNAQKSFKLNARRANGDTRLRAKLFSNRDYEEVKNVTIRASGQDYKSTHMLDSVLTSLAAGTHVWYQESEVCAVYVNNQYWGLYNMREHVDAHSLCQYEGWTDPDSVTIIAGDGEGAGASAGSSQGYKAFWKWLKTADLTRAADMEAMRQAFDIDSYLDYVILEMFTNNSDLGNIRCYRSETEDPRWKYILYDLDLSFRDKKSDPANNVKSWFNNKVGSTTSQETLPFRKLMQNAEVRDRFLTRMGELLADNLSSQNVVSKIEARRDRIAAEMEYNCKRWKWKYSDWEKNVARIIRYAQTRPARMVQYCQEAFKLSDSDTQKYFAEAIAAIQAYQKTLPAEEATEN